MFLVPDTPASASHGLPRSPVFPRVPLFFILYSLRQFTLAGENEMLTVLNGVSPLTKTAEPDSEYFLFSL
jgi:hypothetical protein